MDLNKFFSIDIETSGLSEKKDFIWSMGISSKEKDREFFITPPSEKKAKKMYEKNIFNKKGYFDEYKSSLSKEESFLAGDAVEQLFKDIDKESVVLIQNHHFENKFLGEVFRGSGYQDIKGKFQSIGDPTDGRILNTPLEVTKLRHQAMRKQALFHQERNPATRKKKVEEIDAIYKKIDAEYRKAIGKKDGAVVVDLMDVSKSMYSSAAKNNLISNSHLGIGSSVDFLKKALFPGTGSEAHTSLLDAKDQISIYNKLKEITLRVGKGKTSKEDVKTFTRIRAAMPYESSRQFISGLRNTLEEIKNNGETKLKNPIFIGRDEGISYTSSKKEARAHVVERYINRDTGGINVKKFSDSLNSKTMDEQLDFLRRQESIFKDKVDDRLKNGASVQQSVKDLIPGGKSKYIAAAALMIGGLYLMTRGGEKEKSYEQIKKEKKYERSNDKTFSMYSNPGTYHGTGFYMWDNAVRHHEY